MIARLNRCRAIPGFIAVASITFSGVSAYAGTQDSERAPYQWVSAFGRNGVYDVTLRACDIDRGCLTRQGAFCAETPNEPCLQAVVPAGRCTNRWPLHAGQFGSGQCEATLVHVGPNGLFPGGIPCLSDAYRAALERGDDGTLSSLERVDGPSTMCPVGTTHGGLSSVFPEATGVCDMSTNSNWVNCQSTDPSGTIRLGSAEGSTWEGDVCLGLPICSDGDPLLQIGGLGTSVCGRSPSFDFPGLDFGASCARDDRFGGPDSPLNLVERPFAGSSAVRGPGTALVHERRSTVVVEIQTKENADAETLGVRQVSLIGRSFWADPLL